MWCQPHRKRRCWPRVPLSSSTKCVRAGLAAVRVRAVGYKEKLVGENIAYGPKSAEEVVQGWLSSPGHCENIMDPRFAEMGIAYAPGHASKRGLYWVQLLADPLT